MFLDVPGTLFTVDGVPAALIRPGEPRFRGPDRLEAVAAERVDARPRATLFGRLPRPAAS